MLSISGKCRRDAGEYSMNFNVLALAKLADGICGSGRLFPRPGHDDPSGPTC